MWSRRPDLPPPPRGRSPQRLVALHARFLRELVPARRVENVGVSGPRDDDRRGDRRSQRSEGPRAPPAHRGQEGGPDQVAPTQLTRVPPSHDAETAVFVPPNAVFPELQEVDTT